MKISDSGHSYKRGDVVEIKMMGIVQETYGRDGYRITVDPRDASKVYSNSRKQARFWTLVPKSAIRLLGK